MGFVISEGMFVSKNERAHRSTGRRWLRGTPRLTHESVQRVRGRTFYSKPAYAHLPHCVLPELKRDDHTPSPNDSSATLSIYQANGLIAQTLYQPRTQRAYSFTVTVFTSEYCCSPYSPNSRPIPDCLNPPNGAPASNTSKQLIQTVPARTLLAT